MSKLWNIFVSITLLLPAAVFGDDAHDTFFREKIARILEQNCVRCHQASDSKGKLNLTQLKFAFRGGESGAAVVPGKPGDSLLLDFVAGDNPEMPKNGDPLTATQVAALREWIKDGAFWPVGVVLKEDRMNWWSLKPLVKPSVPKLDAEDQRWVRTPIDALIIAKLRERGLQPSAAADRRTLIRRLYYNLIGLPPMPKEIEAFIADEDPRAYGKLVDRLLASKHYGERWARHWLDVVHYGDTHGYDKDKLRPNAWPYRDYVIRAFNEDKRYSRFVREQLAGDVLYPGTRDGIVATGFIAAGPWDFVGHAEVAESKIDGQIARNLDRDDMVSATMNTFVSMTVQCGRCHDHKFDPINQEDYYSLQAVFAALDRADRPFDGSPEIATRRKQLQQRQQELAARKQQVDRQVQQRAGKPLADVDRRIAALHAQAKRGASAAFGYHSRIEPTANAVKWVQVDLGTATSIDHIVFVGCHDTFNGIGAGFGFPRRFKIELSNDAKFAAGVTVVLDRTKSDVANPKVEPQSVDAGGKQARYVRITATKLAPRQNDYIFALAELMVLNADGRNVARDVKVTALDSIQAPVRWQRRNLVDGYYFGIAAGGGNAAELAKLQARRRQIIDRAAGQKLKADLATLIQSQQAVSNKRKQLPARGMVYAGTVHYGSGNFRGTHGKTRVIRVLHRGDVRSPGKLVSAGTVPIMSGVPARFELPDGHGEGERRTALANWIVDRRNPLTWRSIVNRIWQYHFGHGIVDSPNDFGRMGERPTHPRLLDWLAIELRDGEQSFKRLHRLIVTSAVYRQSSASNEKSATIDAGNQFLWRMNRRRLEAESIRDAVLLVSGKLNRKMYGPGFRAFVLEKPQHSPHYQYHKHDPDDLATHRRSVYRFIVRSAPDPFMETLDCADPSLMVGRRNETLTALQALALLNNKFMVRMAGHMAGRLAKSRPELRDQVHAAFYESIGRKPSLMALQQLTQYARQHGLANACRVIVNLNEFVFVD